MICHLFPRWICYDHCFLAYVFVMYILSFLAILGNIIFNISVSCVIISKFISCLFLTKLGLFKKAIDCFYFLFPYIYLKNPILAFYILLLVLLRSFLVSSNFSGVLLYIIFLFFIFNCAFISSDHYSVCQFLLVCL